MSSVSWDTDRGEPGREKYSGCNKSLLVSETTMKLGDGEGGRGTRVGDAHRTDWMEKPGDGGRAMHVGSEGTGPASAGIDMEPTGVAGWSFSGGGRVLLAPEGESPIEGSSTDSATFDRLGDDERPPNLKVDILERSSPATPFLASHSALIRLAALASPSESGWI